ncbi:MAG: hypothetical protein IIB95_00545 [Candidatus Marinimicrobia bacterium]|nr:hypothetical protein [Candidatus Neomarinimicrobiota bacterium]
MAITPKQKAVFQYIKIYLKENNFSPTFEEIAHYFGYRSKGTVYKHIKALKQKGLIRQDWNRVRSIKLSGEKKETIDMLPVKGKWKRGQIKWLEQPYNYIGAPPNIVHNNHSYIIIMKTDDLIKENIINGDMLVVQPSISKHVSGKIIIENKNGGARLGRASRISNQKKYTGQITGVFRVL